MVCEEGCTPADAKKLHEANAGLATESFNLKARIEEMSELCLTNAEVDKIKADAIREAAKMLDERARRVSDKGHREMVILSSSVCTSYADKLEAGS